jgi:hypothetical protein
MKWIAGPLAATSALLLATAVAAQAPPKNVRGEVVELAADRIAVRTASGPVLRMRLAPEWSVQVMRPIDVAGIQPGAFVGVVETPDGDVGRAHEVHKFLPGVRMGEGRQPWDRPAGSTLTSGDIGPVAKTDKGHTFELTFQGGKRRIVVPDGTPAVLINNEGRENIKVGVHVFILAWPEANGGLRVDAVATGEGGRLPPL